VLGDRFEILAAAVAATLLKHHPIAHIHGRRSHGRGRPVRRRPSATPSPKMACGALRLPPNRTGGRVIQMGEKTRIFVFNFRAAPPGWILPIPAACHEPARNCSQPLGIGGPERFPCS